MQPGTELEPPALTCALPSPLADRVEQPALSIGVAIVPARVVEDRHVDLFDLFVHVEFPPIIIVVRVLDQVLEHVRHDGVPDRQVPLLLPAVPFEPGVIRHGHVGAGRLPAHGEGTGLGHLALSQQPSGEVHLESAPLVVDVPVGVAEGVGAEDRGQVGGVVGEDRVLVHAGEREPHRSDLAGGPGLRPRPLHRVVAVGTEDPVPVVLPFRPVATPLVLDQHRVSPCREVVGMRIAAVALVVGGPLHDHRPRAGPLGGKVDVRGQPDAVAHWDHHLPALVGLRRGRAGNRQDRYGDGKAMEDPGLPAHSSSSGFGARSGGGSAGRRPR